MLMTNKEKEIVSFLKEEYPEAKATLIFHNPLECLLAILLSAQTTDKSVNQVTPPLFERFPTSKELANANVKDIENCIRSIGLYHNKARNIHALATVLEEKYGGRIPMKKEELMKLPGIGNKTAGVFLLEMGKEQYFPVDTHIKRISTRLGYAKKKWNPLKLKKGWKRYSLRKNGLIFITLSSISEEIYARPFILFARNANWANTASI